MAAALAEVHIGLPGKAGLPLGHRFDDELCFLEEIVQSLC